MKNILVTGGSGFIGSNFIRHLLEDLKFDGRVINLDKLTYAGNAMNLADFMESRSSQYTFVHGDIEDSALLEDTFKKYEVDTICHFAAESHVDRSIIEPGTFIHTNIVGTYTLLEAAKKLGDRLYRFHHVSTDEVFGSLGETGFFTETTPYQPNSPYSASKASSDHLVRAYHHTYGLPMTISNCSNNYGPYQFPEKLIPLLILNAARGKELPIYGDGKNVRDWLYVRDHCEAIWHILKKSKVGEYYAIGGNCEMRNIEIAEKVCDILETTDAPKPKEGKFRNLIKFVKDRPGHDFRYAIDCTKIKKDLGWSPKENFESGITKTVAWYLSSKEWVKQVQSGAYRDWIQKNYGI